MIKQLMILFSCATAFTFTTKASEYNNYPATQKCNEIKKAFLDSEVSKRNLVTTTARIEKKRQQFEESERGKCTEIYCEFTVPLKRTFPENSQEPLAKLAVNAVKDQEQNRQWGWYIVYRWNTNNDNSRSLWCKVDVQPDELLLAYQSDDV